MNDFVETLRSESKRLEKEIEDKKAEKQSVDDLLARYESRPPKVVRAKPDGEAAKPRIPLLKPMSNLFRDMRDEDSFTPQQVAVKLGRDTTGTDIAFVKRTLETLIARGDVKMNSLGLYEKAKKLK